MMILHIFRWQLQVVVEGKEAAAGLEIGGDPRTHRQQIGAVHRMAQHEERDDEIELATELAYMGGRARRLAQLAALMRSTSRPPGAGLLCLIATLAAAPAIQVPALITVEVMLMPSLILSTWSIFATFCPAA